MLDWKDMRDELARLEAYVDGWVASGEAPAIERDAVLEKLRVLYEAVRFAAAAPVIGPISTSMPRTEPIEEEEPEVFAAIDLDSVIALDASPTDEPAAFMAEPAAVPDPSSEAAVPPDPLPASERIADATAMPALQPEAPLTELRAADPAAEPLPQEETPAEKTEARPIENSLFDLGEWTVRRRGSRRVLMSLYDDETAEPVRPKRRAASPRPETPRHDNLSAEAPLPSLSEQRGEASASESEEHTISIIELADEVSQPKREAEARVCAVAADEPAASVPLPEPARSEVFAAEGFDAPAVLGETMRSDTPTLGESIPAPENVVSRLVRSERLVDLRSGLGVNDRFLLLRDLFSGDERAYKETLGRLDAFDDLDECMIYIAEHFAWNPNSDGAKLLTELLERKLG